MASPAPTGRGGAPSIVPDGLPSAGSAPTAATLPSAGTGSGRTGVAAAPADASVAGQEERLADGIREYRMALGIRAKRFRHYPEVARENGWEGEPSVAVRLGAAMAAPTVALEKSSPYPALDEQALDTVRRAVLATPVPESIRGRELRIVFSVSYSLTDD